MLKFAVSLVILLSFNWSVAKDCQLEIKKDSIQVEWTGYKTTDKVGVTGKFLEVHWVSKTRSVDIHSALSNAEFTIDGLKFDAGNMARNMNLKKHFFKKFADKAHIKGRVHKIGKGTKGELDLELFLNNVNHHIPMKYEIKGNKVIAVGTMEMSDFSLGKALVSISKACFELHKGKDGVSKTWPTVDLKASAEFKKVCK